MTRLPSDRKALKGVVTDLKGVLFVENRDKTRFWAEIARVLTARGVPVHWLVQNPVYAPVGAGRVHEIGFPNRTELASAEVDLASYPEILSDRGRRYFNSGSRHYPFYHRRINEIMAHVSPALIVGESTLLHELFAAESARRQGAVFVHPAATRYPSRRVNLFEGVTQLEFIGSGDEGDEEENFRLAERISNGSISPSYMRKPPLGAGLAKRLRWADARLRVWRGRLAGERYNTPSFRTKAALWRRLNANVGRWDRLAKDDCSGPAILYPLQLQPEANLDVWGHPFSDQVAFIRRLLSATGSDVSILIKINPKAKYEMSDALLALAESEARVVLLSRSLPMAKAQALAIGAVTVSGTVGLEAVFGRGRCISLRHPLIERWFPEFAAPTPEEATEKLLSQPDAGTGSAACGAKLIAKIRASSFEGFISDPVSDPACLDPSNIILVADAIHKAWDAARNSASAAHPEGC